MSARRKSTEKGPSRARGARTAADAATPDSPAAPLRIIGGRFARRRLAYSGDPRTRPMKDRVREAVFNLVGPSVVGMHAVDLFAGTGALGLEALSRGATRATFIEQHFPTAQVIRENVATLGVAGETEVCPANAFIWARRPTMSAELPWLIFCSPPYEFYVSRGAEVVEMLDRLMGAAPPRSIFVVESDSRFDFSLLPDAAAWDVREYPPAKIAIHRPPRDA